MYCTRCGAEHSDGAAFCRRCGNRFADAVDGGQPRPAQAAPQAPGGWAPPGGWPPPMPQGVPPTAGGWAQPGAQAWAPAAPAPPPPPPPSAGPAGHGRPSARRGRTPVIVAVVVVVVLAGLGVAGWQKHWPPALFGSTAPPPLAWSAAKAPLPSDAVGGNNQDAQLEAISCPAAGSCVAVGSYEANDGSGTVPKAVTETLSDGTWGAAAAPGLTASLGGIASLIGVACPAEGSCVAVGDRTTSQGVSTPEIETLSGGDWTMAHAMLPGDADLSKSAYVNDIACPAAGTCVATGRYTDKSGVTQGLLDTLSGGTWTAIKAPLPGDADPAKASSQNNTFLTDVACTAVGTCVASGQYTDSAGGTQGVIETLSGGTWTTGKAPLPGDAATTVQLASLWAITCQAPGNCLAGGHYISQNGQPRYLAETLSAGTWAAAAPPLPAGAAANQKWSQEQATSLGGVACEAAGYCVASASYLTPNGEIAPVIDTLSGGTWTAASAPLPGGAAQAAKQVAYLTLVACPATGSCLTVGSYTAQGGGTQGLIETAVPSR